MSTELVSIGMPVFNDKKFLSKAIDSLLSQSYTNFELILSDDNSTDGSAEICKRYERVDSRVRYVRQHKNLGISRNMQFLLQQAKGEYFMWAANDDIWDKDFIRILVDGLRAKPEAIVSFCPTMYVDEDDQSISEKRAFDYSGKTPNERIAKLIHYQDDSFGYGLFRKDQIQGVRFPVWWWINRKCAYNNIYPSLCFYLSKGDFVFNNSVKPLWLNRLKDEKNVNHKVPYYNKFLRGISAYSLRKFNLVFESLKCIYIGSRNWKLVAMVLPLMCFRWFVVPSYQAWKMGLIKLWNRKLDFF